MTVLSVMNLALLYNKKLSNKVILDLMFSKSNTFRLRAFKLYEVFNL